MTYENINSILLDRFPELADDINKETNYWKGEIVPSHILFAYAFNHSGFMASLLLAESDEMLVKRVFSFFEEMATCADVEVRNLLKVTLLEYLWGDFDLLKRARKLMHTYTRKLCDELQVFFGRFDDGE